MIDPFAGDGAIPLEATRLGCEVTAIDINPVVWFILKSTLESPQRLASQHRSLPDFAAKPLEFMASFFKASAKTKKKQFARNLDTVRLGLFPPLDVDLVGQIRTWGGWVLERAKADLARFYPVIGGKPKEAYLCARTVTCKGCRAQIPLLKTRWLAKSDECSLLESISNQLVARGGDLRQRSLQLPFEQGGST